MSDKTVSYQYIRSNGTVGVDINIAGLSGEEAGAFTEEVLALAKQKYGAQLTGVSFLGFGPDITLPKKETLN